MTIKLTPKGRRQSMTPSEAEQYCAGYIHTGSAEIVHTYTDAIGDRCLYIEQSGGKYHVTVSNVSEAYDNLPAAEARLFIMMNKPTPEQCREAIIWESEPPMELIESLEWPELTAWSATHDNCTTSEAADQIISAMRETYYYGMRRTAR